ncbi:OLC1v1034826C1 [Oldenlandia corymbosa var. corymbosa]|uniref:OLC1v1034826C1 n=1 Tax=Oldenlandia corymbosa var. corymbosa TaxID=529605 RepID=A0AAV1CRN8_OLDCO|nr:OLC1v1034826C1 [Oldenlandia corymbosa var. corymbosa]
MDSNNLRAAQGQTNPVPPRQSHVISAGEASAVTNVLFPTAMDGAGDWKTEVQADSRRRIINKMVDKVIRMSLKKYYDLIMSKKNCKSSREPSQGLKKWCKMLQQARYVKHSLRARL